MVSTKAVRTAIYAKLNVASVTTLLANGSASLYHAVAASTAAYPFVLFQKQSGTPVDVFGKQAFRSDLWLVKAVDSGTGIVSSSRAEDIDKAINDVLDFQTLTVSGGTNLDLRRESDIDYRETDGDRQYLHHGALYRCVVAD